MVRDVSLRIWHCMAQRVWYGLWLVYLMCMEMDTTVVAGTGRNDLACFPFSRFHPFWGNSLGLEIYTICF